MTRVNQTRQAKALDLLASELDIPESHYQKAKSRYESIGRWFERDESTIRHLDVSVSPHGSFRDGTVKPSDRAYDLDLICELMALSKLQCSQESVKEAVGREVKSYAEAHGMHADPVPTKRCWRMEYAEDGGVNFHADILPVVPEDEETKQRLALVVPGNLSDLSVAITDSTHPSYGEISGDWPMSNPRGYGRWFQSRMKQAAQVLHFQRAEEMPPHRWNTPLQKVVRILKDHRDTMFVDRLELKPVSIIVTTLAAHAYEGQTNLQAAITAIVERMPEFVINRKILNPTNPGENFADKWERDSQLQMAFWQWMTQLSKDIQSLGHDLGPDGMQYQFSERFGLELAAEKFSAFTKIGSVVSVAPSVSKPKPWGIGN